MLANGLHLTTPLMAEWDSFRWAHFKPWELACNCPRKAPHFCQGEYFHDPAFLDGLMGLRVRVARPLRINSGHRCAKRNVYAGGATNSQHLTIAADISLDGHDRWALRAAAEAEGFTGVGLGLGFLHVDRRASRAVWDYGAASQRAWKR